MSSGIFLISMLLLTVFFMLSLLRALNRLRKDRERSRGREDSQVGFVIGTFHELVAKLKEKEKELETMRRKAEERADVIESYNEYILQSVPSGVISLDSSMRITKVNSAAERILELRAGDVIGKSYTDVFREPLRGVLDGRNLIERGEVQYTTHSGKNIHIGLALTPLMNADRETIGQLIVFTDLTELKALQSQAELRDRLSSLGEMAAGMAHELRNPMGVIAGYTKMLHKRVDPSLSHLVDAISKEVSVMDRIITDFLCFARPAEMNISAVDLSPLLKGCITSTVGLRKDIRVHLDRGDIPLISGDEILLRQAFTNLIQNAVEAMPQGGDLRINLSVEADHLEIGISDTGHGISEKIRDKIFLPFYTTKEGGTGLGLAIVHKIVASHRGSIGVDSSDKGTTFRVRLPLKAETGDRK